MHQFNSVTPLLREQAGSQPFLSVIVPFYNEQAVLPEFHRRLLQVLKQIPQICEVIYIDDGSTDQSLQIAQQFDTAHHQVRCIKLSRNFGKEAAMSAGLNYSQGQAVVLIDADLQDPPELILEMLSQWQLGYDIVNMQRKSRQGESWFKRFSASGFYKLLNHLSEIDIPENVGDYRLLSRRVVEHINALPERNRYMKGIFAWPGFAQTTLSFERDARFSGYTKWNYFKLLGLAMDGISAFSIRPLRLASWAGALLCLSSGLAAIYLFAQQWVTTVETTSLILAAQGFFAGIQLLALGLLGEYVGRIFIETKQRPLYLVQAVHDNKKPQARAKIQPIKSAFKEQRA